MGTEHLLIAILKESDCVATRLLFTMGINIQKLYGAILTAMGEAPLQGGAQAEMQIPAADRRQEVERRPAKRRHWTSTAGI